MLEKNDKIRDYTLVRFLGKGQFGEVWLAEKEFQFGNRKFRHALKFLSNLGNEIDLKAAEAEIDTWIEVSGHPNVMSVLDMFTYRKHIIIVSEFAQGGSLRAWLEKSEGKAPTRENALKTMIGILSGIEHLHSRNVIHRDLKPDNILLQGNFPRITDFGISRIVSTDSMLTKVIGSPAYMSPESFDGIKSPQTDIWSAGIILYEMLTGGHPFQSETIFGLVAAIQRDEPTLLPEDIPEELRQVVEMALQRNLEKRFRTARDMRLALEQVTYYLKGHSKSQAAVTEVLPDAFGYIDPYAVTESIGDNFSVATVNKPLIDVAQIPYTQRRTEHPNDAETSEVKKGSDASELETRTSLEIARSLGTFGVNTKDDLEKGRTAKSKRPLLIIGGIGSVLILVLVVSFIGLLAVVRAIFFGPSDASGNAVGNTNTVAKTNTLSNAVPPNAIPNGNSPTAPRGMVYVTGGEATIGRDAAKFPDEGPAHKVSVEPFFMDIYEVTNEKYAEFVKAKNHAPPTGWRANTYPEGKGKFPVVGVNWYDAAAYAAFVGKRLPTEEEWEFAARGTQGFLYPWGNEWKTGNANVGNKELAEVGSFAGRSPFNIFDMIGNAWEWTASDFKAYSNESRSTVRRGDGNLKTIRGGSFEAIEESRTATYRTGWKANGAATYDQTGFRCVKDLEK